MESKGQNKRNRNRLTDKENRWKVARGEGIAGLGERNEGIRKYRLAVTK